MGRGGPQRGFSEAGVRCREAEHLLLQVVQVLPVDLVHLLGIADNGIWVGLRVSRHSDAKVLTVLVPVQTALISQALLFKTNSSL